MKTFIAMLIISLAGYLNTFAQNQDLIVTTKLDSIWCELKNTGAIEVSYFVGDSLKTISTEKIYLIQKKWQKRPKYYNEDIEVKSIMLETKAVESKQVRTQSQTALIEPWRKKAAARLRSGGALLLGSAILSVGGSLVLSRGSSDQAFGNILLVGGGVAFLASGVSFMSAASAIAPN